MTTTRPAIIERQTHAAKEIVDITVRVEALIGGASGGSCHLFIKHATAGRRREIAMRLLAER